tara:strand:- start:130 stop:660 length:531 start_codon:yes stop_codon:yes gene_type:complete
LDAGFTVAPLTKCIPGTNSRTPAIHDKSLVKYSPALACIIALGASYLLGYTPLIISAFYLALSLLTVLFYAIDKSAARNDKSRTPETNLHLLALFSGWPGAVIAQQLFRHKTIKPGFRQVFWGTVIINCGAFIWIHTNAGSQYLNTYIFRVEEIILAEISNSTVQSILFRLLGFHS